MKKSISDLKIGDFVYVITGHTDVVNAELWAYKVTSEPCLVSSEIEDDRLVETFEIKMIGGSRYDEVTINDCTYDQYKFVCHTKAEIYRMKENWYYSMLKFLFYKEFNKYE